jgi:hypothetical protein
MEVKCVFRKDGFDARDQMPGAFGFSSDPGGRIVCVHRSTIIRPPVDFRLLLVRSWRRRLLALAFSMSPSDVHSGSLPSIAAPRC